MDYKLYSCWEHFEGEIDLPEISDSSLKEMEFLFPKNRGELPCFSISRNEDKFTLKTNYFIGVDWIEKNNSAVYVAPKLNTKNSEDVLVESLKEIDYLKMLFNCLEHSDVSKVIDELFIIKWDEPEIIIHQKQDLLTPLLVVEFLGILKTIVRKGLKKSYYKVERNLNGRIKGKVLVGKTIKNNILKNKNLNTICAFEEFGLNNKENKLLKKALLFVKQYLPSYSNIYTNNFLEDVLNYITPAFEEVSSKIELNEIKTLKHNAFYKEYEKAIELAQLILKRFGYNISNIEKQEISTPPFWIDMSNLFELYVLGLLKDRFQNQVKYHFTHYGNELDFILKSDSYKIVIDAKYKPKYSRRKDDTDIRQVSGYARLKKVYKFLEKTYPDSIDCLIIYPDQENGFTNLENVQLLKNRIASYFGVYKVGVKLPIVE